ncbi:unnamed protein product [Protopolystoma xenopodis]|uniref:TRPM SLOG domain-containing protein n=1 Tax=Protopolystoma xenopodis TaxID=117903 RepID=A0A3S5AU35_9PLAT|nr:unnamed protein product [Protopolystoma xenopodis]
MNPHHNYFLLADNGTSGKFGSELCLRRRLEQYLAQQPIDMRRYGEWLIFILALASLYRWLDWQ